MFISRKDLDELIREECQHDRIWYGISKEEYSELCLRIAAMEKYLGITYDIVPYFKKITNKKK